MCDSFRYLNFVIAMRMQLIFGQHWSARTVIKEGAVEEDGIGATERVGERMTDGGTTPGGTKGKSRKSKRKSQK